MQGALAHLEDYREHFVAEQVIRRPAGRPVLCWAAVGWAAVGWAVLCWPVLCWPVLCWHERMILCPPSVFD